MPSILHSQYCEYRMRVIPARRSTRICALDTYRSSRYIIPTPARTRATTSDRLTTASRSSRARNAGVLTLAYARGHCNNSNSEVMMQPDERGSTDDAFFAKRNGAARRRAARITRTSVYIAAPYGSARNARRGSKSRSKREEKRNDEKG